MDSDEGMESDTSSSAESDTGNDGNAAVESSGAAETESSSDDDDVDMDLKNIENKLEEINEKLLTSPYNYDLLVEKIELLRSSGDLPALRRAREKMSEYYPLSERLWLNWISDELNISDSEEEKAAVVELFDRAVQDYLCEEAPKHWTYNAVEVWLEYIKFALSQMGEETGIQKCRDICERALAVAGLHVPLGSLLWDAYRDFEAAVLGLPLSAEEKIAQEKRYTDLCRRQISVPLFGMEQSLEDISSKIEFDDALKDISSAALQKLKSIEIYEQELANVDSEDLLSKSAIYQRYIDAEKKDKSNPARIQCLYERAVADCPLDSSLWLSYLSYVAHTLKIPDIVLKVAERAVRNCPWVLECWTEYFLCVEAFDSSKLLGIFEKAILNFTTVEQVGTLWLKYLECLRRLLRANDFPEKDVEKFRSTAKAAERHILELSPDSEPNEYVFQIIMMSVRLSVYQSKAMTEAREHWKELLLRGYGYSFKNWLQYLLLERQFGDDACYRQQLSRAVSYIKDDLQSIADMWLNYERDNGNVGQLHTCEKKISKYLQSATVAEVSSGNSTGAPHSERPEKFSQSGKNKRKMFSGSDISPKKPKGQDVPDGKAFKTPLPPKSASSIEKTKASEDFTTRVHHDHSKDERTVFASNLAFTADETQIRDFFKDVGVISELRLVKDFKGRSKGYAYVVFESQASVAKALAKDREALSGRPVFVSKCDPDKSTRTSSFKFPSKLEKNKLFVKGLPASVSVEDLRKMFSPYGPLKDVRLVTFRNGHSKGLAYVDFEDEKSAARAMQETNETDVGGNIISVAISNPPPKKESARDLPSDMLILQRKPPTAFVPRSLHVQKKTETASVPAVPLSNEDFKKLFVAPAKK